MTDLVEYFVHGRGSGHGSRCHAVLRALSGLGLPVRLHVGGDALRVVRDVLPQYEWRRREPILPNLAATIQVAARTSRDVATFRRKPPGLVISDGDQSAALAAGIVGVPSLVIGHDQIFAGGVDLPEVPRWPLYHQRLNALPMRAGRRFIGVHFLPVASRHPHVRVARPDTPTVATQSGPDGQLVAYFRDGNGDELVRYLAASGYPVRCFGDGPPPHPLVTMAPFDRRSFLEALASSSGAVGSAGSNLIAECVALRKPLLALYRRGDAEQQLNATLATIAGVAVGSSFDAAIPRGVRSYLTRLRGNEFESVDIERAMDPLSTVVTRSVRELLNVQAPSPEQVSSSLNSVAAE